jgi:hypothetical protein
MANEISQVGPTPEKCRRNSIDVPRSFGEVVETTTQYLQTTNSEGIRHVRQSPDS